MSRIGKYVETESKLMVARAYKEGRSGVTAKVYRVSFGVMKIF